MYDRSDLLRDRAEGLKKGQPDMAQTRLQQLRAELNAAELEAKAADEAAYHALQCEAYLSLRGYSDAQSLVDAMRAQADAHKALKAARTAYYEACARDAETAPLYRDNKPFSIFKS